MGNKILVTGGSGFIGTNLIDYFLLKGDNVLNIDIKEPKKIEHIKFWINQDIRDFNSTLGIVTDFGPDFVIHLAARADMTGKTIDAYSSNILGVKNIMEICNEVQVLKKVIFTSTMLVCKAGYTPQNDIDYCPPNLYGESKMLGELVIRDASSSLRYNWAIIRPTSIWGPWFGKGYKDFFEMALKGRYFNFSGKMSVKTYGFVGNSVYQISEILKNESSNYGTFYIGDYSPTNIKDWASEIAGYNSKKIYNLPNSIVRILGWIGDLLNQLSIKFPMNSFRYRNMTTDNVVPMKKTMALAPDTKFTREDGNLQTIGWIKCYYNLNKQL